VSSIPLAAVSAKNRLPSDMYLISCMLIGKIINYVRLSCNEIKVEFIYLFIINTVLQPCIYTKHIMQLQTNSTEFHVNLTTLVSYIFWQIVIIKKKLTSVSRVSHFRFSCRFSDLSRSFSVLHSIICCSNVCTYCRPIKINIQLKFYFENHYYIKLCNIWSARKMCDLVQTPPRNNPL